MSKFDKHYTNGEITIYWQPDKCKHSGNCVRGLPAVFNYAKHPWIEMNGVPSAEIIEAVNRCPSGALSWFENKK